MKLDFTKRSRSAVLIFAICFLVIVLLPRIYFYYKPTTTYSLSEAMSQLPDSEKKIVKERLKNYHQVKKDTKKSKYQKPPSKFNPNEYDLVQWMNLGLSEKQAQTILKFNKYGFYSEDDMKKCFIFDNQEFYNIIKDSIVFENKNSVKKEYLSTVAVDLNRATKDELMQLKGIGAFYADKIIEYRTKLGGFLNANQLLEIYKFDQEKLKSIKPYLLINKKEVQKMDLNTVDAKTLKNHPYLNNWNIANSIVKMRAQKGKYTSIEEIKESVLMTDSIYTKIEPYIIVQ